MDTGRLVWGRTVKRAGWETWSKGHECKTSLKWPVFPHIAAQAKPRPHGVGRHIWFRVSAGPCWIILSFPPSLGSSEVGPQLPLWPHQFPLRKQSMVEGCKALALSLVLLVPHPPFPPNPCALTGGSCPLSRLLLFLPFQKHRRGRRFVSMSPVQDLKGRG